MIKKKKISQKDKDVWQDYIKSPNDIVDKDIVLNENKSNNYRFKYDLHGFSLISANEKIREIILSCVKNNYKEILLITGKGIHSNTEHNVYASKDLSKIKYSIPEYIKFNLDISKYVLSISNAEKKDGGDGAIIIKLKNL